MNTYSLQIGSVDPKNPEHCRIRRVENGWIFVVGYDWVEIGSRPLAEYVFTSQGALADFIKTNFRMPPKEDK